MDAVLISRLERSGLTHNEAKVYAALLGTRELMSTDVSKRANTDRSLTYSLLNALAGKGLVTFSVRNRKRYFALTDAENLLTPIIDQRESVSLLVDDIKKMTPQDLPDQSFSVYEGIEGMKAYGRLLLTQQHFGSFGGTGKFYDLMLQHAPHFLRDAAGSFESGRIIGDASLGAHPINDIIGARVRVLPVVSPATTTVTDDFVAFHLITRNPFAIVVRNTEIVESYWNYFEFLWRQAQPTKKRYEKSPSKK